MIMVSRKARIAVSLWIVGLLLYIGITRTARYPLNPPGEAGFTVPNGHQLNLYNPASDERFDLFADSRTVAIVLVSATCETCIARGDLILQRLNQLPADVRIVVSTDNPDALNGLPLAVGDPRELRFVPDDFAALESLDIRYVPTFAVIRDGRVMASWSGLPGPANMLWLRTQVWRSSKAIGPS
jgi:hypothetical protein